MSKKAILLIILCATGQVLLPTKKDSARKNQFSKYKKIMNKASKELSANNSEWLTALENIDHEAEVPKPPLADGEAIKAYKEAAKKLYALHETELNRAPLLLKKLKSSKKVSWDPSVGEPKSDKPHHVAPQKKQTSKNTCKQETLKIAAISSGFLVFCFLKQLSSTLDK